MKANYVRLQCLGAQTPLQLNSLFRHPRLGDARRWPLGVARFVYQICEMLYWVYWYAGNISEYLLYSVSCRNNFDQVYSRPVVRYHISPYLGWSEITDDDRRG